MVEVDLDGDNPRLPQQKPPNQTRIMMVSGMVVALVVMGWAGVVVFTEVRPEQAVSTNTSGEKVTVAEFKGFGPGHPREFTSGGRDYTLDVQANCNWTATVQEVR